MFWGLWEQTPAGATLHEITEGLDKEPVVMQIQVPQERGDTGASLHRRVRDAEREIFLRVWPRVAARDLPPARPPSSDSAGSYHAKPEFDALREGADVEAVTGAELLRLARAFTFPGFAGLASAPATGASRCALRRCRGADPR